MQIAAIKKGAKVTGLIFLIVAALLAAVYFGSGVKTMFVKASSCPAQKVSAEKVSANSAVIAWASEDETQGRVEYGTNATNLTFSAPEGASGKTHNVPLTLLTPNTIYYYMVTIGKNKCDSSGQVCDKTCVPWSFSTTGITPQAGIVANLPSPTQMASPSATVKLNPTTIPVVSQKPATGAATIKPSASPTVRAAVIATPTGTLSTFCKQVVANLGKTSTDPNWASIKQYDFNNDSRIMGSDIMPCIKSGK